MVLGRFENNLHNILKIVCQSQENLLINSKDYSEQELFSVEK
jgi:hypothetical protein